MKKALLSRYNDGYNDDTIRDGYIVSLSRGIGACMNVATEVKQRLSLNVNVLRVFRPFFCFSHFFRAIIPLCHHRFWEVVVERGGGHHDVVTHRTRIANVFRD